MRYKLLPHKFKKLGWFLLIPGIILFIAVPEIGWLDARVPALINGELFEKAQFFTWVSTNMTFTLYGILILTGALLVCFSREKIEDEYIGELRLSALLWAVFLHSVLLLLAFLLVYGAAFWFVLLFNMFTPLLLFILRFHYLLYRHSKAALHEKHT